jgi:nucleoside-diphosphate-sugar epimerase
MRLFIFGIGYSARAIARTLAPAAESIAGTTRDPDKAAALRAEGYKAILLDGLAPDDGVTAALASATHLLVSIAPAAEGDPVLEYFADAIRRMPHLQWIGYLSTVGVYGDHAGAWVDETSACRPVSRRSVWRAAAERAWGTLGAERAVPTAIFRLAGIYGPGRNAFENFARGTARRIDKPGQVFNRIHVDDIAAVAAAAAVLRAGGIFNVTDDEPAPPQDVVAHAAALLGVAPPPLVPFAEAALSPMGRSFYGENKRVSNGKIKDMLGVRLQYPTYREGLAALKP